MEMDCVEGKPTDRKAILTLLFRRSRFQLMILLPHKTQESVGRALDFVEMLCGKEAFRLLFRNILTDRGSEFLDPSVIETGIEGDKRCSVFYCDPMKPGQKGAAEKNHVELRRIIPKGVSLDALTAYELSLICSHVNSYTRPILGGVSPFAIATLSIPRDLLDAIGVSEVAPDDVILRPTLLKELGLR